MSHQPKVSNNNNGKIKKQKDLQEEELKTTNANTAQIQLTTNLTTTITNNNLKYFDKIYNDYTNNQIYTWGSNEMGQLGQEYENNTTNKDKEGYIYSSTPLCLKSLLNKQILSVSAGDGHTVCVTKNGNVYSWGASACGQLGLEGIESMPKDSEGYPCQPSPCLIKLLMNVKVKEVACGDAHTIALTNEGKVYSWGGAGCGQLVIIINYY